MMGFKPFHAAAATLAGFEIAPIIREGQFGAGDPTAFQQLTELATQ